MDWGTFSQRGLEKSRQIATTSLQEERSAELKGRWGGANSNSIKTNCILTLKIKYMNYNAAAKSIAYGGAVRFTLLRGR